MIFVSIMAKLKRVLRESDQFLPVSARTVDVIAKSCVQSMFAQIMAISKKKIEQYFTDKKN